MPSAPARPQLQAGAHGPGRRPAMYPARNAGDRARTGRDQVLDGLPTRSSRCQPNSALGLVVHEDDPAVRIDRQQRIRGGGKESAQDLLRSLHVKHELPLPWPKGTPSMSRDDHAERAVGADGPLMLRPSRVPANGSMGPHGTYQVPPCGRRGPGPRRRRWPSCLPAHRQRSLRRAQRPACHGGIARLPDPVRFARLGRRQRWPLGARAGPITTPPPSGSGRTR